MRVQEVVVAEDRRTCPDSERSSQVGQLNEVNAGAKRAERSQGRSVGGYDDTELVASAGEFRSNVCGDPLAASDLRVQQ